MVFEKAEVTPVFERSGIPEDQVMRGPAAITEYSATTVIPPERKFWVDSEENLIIELKNMRVK